MPAANPYVIYIELFKADGVTRPNQNEIARVKAFDVNGTTVTDEGQSGFNPSTGGWLPIYLQNIAAFSPPRDQPNLKFEVWNTAEQLRDGAPFRGIVERRRRAVRVDVTDRFRR